MEKNNLETFCPASRTDWREWLEENHLSKQSVWLICYRKKSNIPTVNWSDSVDEALCFGWIDSTRKTIDDKSFMQLFTKRKPKSNWSKINKEKVERLIENGLMTQAGLNCIEIAKQNGSWTILDAVEALKIPNDFAQALRQYRGSKAHFLSLSKSVKKMILHWIVSAKRAETREKRIGIIAERIANKEKPII